MNTHTPKVSIGVPVYNGGRFIREALDSLLAQTFTDFELIISDNASTDDTEQICREYAGRDSRIRYIRQSENRGPTANFQFLLDEAVGEYFMWAAHDDTRSRNFISVNVDFLCRNSDFIASISPVCFEGGSFNDAQMGVISLDCDKAQRVIRFLRTWHANAYFYALMRRDVLRKCFCVDEFYLGSDWSIVLRLMSEGKLNRSMDGWVVLGRSGFSNSENVFEFFRKGWVDFFFPFSQLFVCVMGLSKKFSLVERSIVLWFLFKLNTKAFLTQFSQRYKKRKAP